MIRMAVRQVVGIAAVVLFYQVDGLAHVLYALLMVTLVENVLSHLNQSHGTVIAVARLRGQVKHLLQPFVLFGLVPRQFAGVAETVQHAESFLAIACCLLAVQQLQVKVVGIAELHAVEKRVGHALGLFERRTVACQLLAIGIIAACAAHNQDYSD